MELNESNDVLKKKNGVSPHSNIFAHVRRNWADFPPILTII